MADTKALLANWDETLFVSENLARFRKENIFGKTSRSRVEDILAIFRQRYLSNESITKALVILVKNQFPAQGLNYIFYFHAATGDFLLHDVITQVIASKKIKGQQEVSVDEVEDWIRQQIAKGRTKSSWSETTVKRSAQELLSTLRDFGLLEGKVKKRLAPIYLPIEAFAYIAFILKQNQPSGERLINDPEWGLFFLPPQTVEHYFMEAHQHRLLVYQAAGSIMRITFPAGSIEEYAHVIAKRAI